MNTCEYCHQDKEDSLTRFYTHPETHRNTFLTLCNSCEDKVRNSKWGEDEAGAWLQKHVLA